MSNKETTFNIFQSINLCQVTLRVLPIPCNPTIVDNLGFSTSFFFFRVKWMARHEAEVKARPVDRQPHLLSITMWQTELHSYRWRQCSNNVWRTCQDGDKFQDRWLKQWNQTFKLGTSAVISPDEGWDPPILPVKGTIQTNQYSPDFHLRYVKESVRYSSAH